MERLVEERRADEIHKSFASFFSSVAFTVLVFGLAFLCILIGCLNKTGRKVFATGDDDDDDGSDQTRPQDQLVRSHHTPMETLPRTKLESATSERFLREIEKEKLIRFSSDEIKSLTNNFSIVIGSGGFGTVYKGQLLSRVPVAVKVLRNTPNKRMKEQFMAEVNAIGRANHINLVRLYGFCFERDMRGLVYEFMEKSSLDHFLFDAKKTVAWEKLMDIAIGTAKGLMYLHEECRNRIIHYDIKPPNILLDGDLRPKVSDFGLAKLCSIDVSQIIMSGCRGTPGYAAPELWEPFPVSHKCDLYSFGIVLFEIVARRRHHDLDVKEESKQWLPRWAWAAFSSGELPLMLSQCGIEEQHMEKAVRMALTALWCIQYSPEARPTTSNLVKMLEGSVKIEPPPFPFKPVSAKMKPPRFPFK